MIRLGTSQGLLSKIITSCVMITFLLLLSVSSCLITSHIPLTNESRSPRIFQDSPHKVQSLSESRHDINVDQIFVPPSVLSDAGPPQVMWYQTFGSSEYDEFIDVIECSSGGYAALGYNDTNMWLLRTNGVGIPLWNQTFGGAELSYGLSITECSDEGFALFGTKLSGSGDAEAWLVRTDSNGVQLWNQTYGGTEWDEGVTVIELADGGFMLLLYTPSYGAGDADAWLIRTNNLGQPQWNQTYGGVLEDTGQKMIECSDGGFAIIGDTENFGAQGTDMWFLKTDNSGNHLWNKTFGGSGYDWGRCLVECSEGGFLLIGSTSSFGAGGNDVWAIRTDENGQPSWNQTFGHTWGDRGYGIVEVSDGGFVIAAEKSPEPTNLKTNWLIAINSSGYQFWNQTYGEGVNEGPYAIVECNQNGFLIAGYYKGLDYDQDASLIRFSWPPVWVQTPENQICEYGSPLRYDLNATAYFGLDEWWINSTLWFSIDPEGVITSAGDLGVSDYGLQVCVNDTKGNVLSVALSIMVQDTTPPSWIIGPTDYELQIGAWLSHQMQAEDLSGIASWEVNNTIHFTIDDSGTLTSQGPLGPGIYPLTIIVKDPYDNQLSGQMVVIVHALQIPPILVYFGIGITICIVVISSIVLYRRRR